MKQAAIYARVSSDRQTQEKTVDSQVAALREMVTAAKHHMLPSDIYLDEGYSGATLLRPALERLRDRVAEGGVDVIYVHSPDRLARKYAYQVVLLEELARAGVEVVFANHKGGQSPEDQLLVQVQGMIAEYEKAKIAERCRRGRLHKARSGAVSVLGGAPYGYLYVRKFGNMEARYEIAPREAEVVRQIFEWFAMDQVALNEIARRLKATSVATRTGQRTWSKKTLWGMLKNPAYAGQACFGKYERVESEKRRRTTGRRTDRVPRRAKSTSRPTPAEKWIPIEVPSIVPPSLFEAAQHQLQRNKLLSQRNNKHGKYLLRGLLVCRKCRYSLFAKMSRHTSVMAPRFYYQCTGTKREDEDGKRVCTERSLPGHHVDHAVWENVKETLRDPERVLDEFLRRNHADGREVSLLKAQREALEKARRTAELTLKRLVDAYEAGAIDLEELKPRTEQARRKIESIERQVRDADHAVGQATELREVVSHLAEFSGRLQEGLETLTFEQQSKLVQLLVDRIEVDADTVQIVYRIPSSGHG